jgi:hypothetical protein
MELRTRDTSNNPETGQKYDRIIYVCTHDDSWITVETPIARSDAT